MNDSFYVTLISSASQDMFPDNRPGQFRNHLPARLDLTNYEVAVIEVSFNVSFPNIYTPNASSFVFRTPGVAPDFHHIPEGVYTTPRALFAKLLPPFAKHPQFGLQLLNTGHLQIRTPNAGGATTLVFAGALLAKLGFTPSQPHTFRPGMGVVAGELPVNPFYGCSQLFLYCSVIEPQFVGNQYDQLLRIIPGHPTQSGEDITQTFLPPCYVPCIAGRFSSIEIHINYLDGVIVPFRSGGLIVVLHFRRILRNDQREGS